MAAIKCVKCGAQIPSKAAFCPNCGAPKAAPQPAAKPVQQPAGPGIGETVEMLFSTKLMVIGILIGIILAGIGKLIITVNFWATYYLVTIGLNCAGAAMLGGGLFNKKMNTTVRGGLATAGGIMLSVANLSLGINF
jgi:hypothetical protein